VNVLLIFGSLKAVLCIMQIHSDDAIVIHSAKLDINILTKEQINGKVD
jgi:hypothetical protein